MPKGYKTGKITVRCARVGIIGTNCYILYDEDVKEAILIDPGDNAQFLIRSIKEAGLKPVAILLTHAHFDHIGAVSEIRGSFDIPIYVGEKDKDMLADGNMNMGGFTVSLNEKDIILKGGESLHIAGIDIDVISTPGHTKGGLCFYIKDANILFSGDTMFRYSWGRTDFPGGNAKELMDSIHDKLLPLPEETVVYPGHEGMTDIRTERITHEYTE